MDTMGAAKKLKSKAPLNLQGGNKQDMEQNDAIYFYFLPK